MKNMKETIFRNISTMNEPHIPESPALAIPDMNVRYQIYHKRGIAVKQPNPIICFIPSNISLSHLTLSYWHYK